jgi:dTDP-4-dehydrorhamnose reductase
MKILVTGSEGQVGCCLVQQLAETNFHVLALDRAALDITNSDKVLEAVSGYKPNVIINAAAYTAVDKAESEKDLAYAINRDGAKYLAQAADSVGAVFLHISTDYVFSGDKQGLYSEADNAAPQGVYGASKLAGELAVTETCARHIILRTAWVFGERGNNFVKTILRLGQSRNELSVVGDQFGGPTYAGDVAKTLLLMVKRLESIGTLRWGLYHYAGYPYVSWYDFAEVILKRSVEHKLLPKLPALSVISTSEYPTPAKRPANSKLDCMKIQSKLGIQPSDWVAALDNIEAYLGSGQ